MNPDTANLQELTDDAPVYESIPVMSQQEIRSAIDSGDASKISIAVVAASLHSADRSWSEEICYELSVHQDSNVRGNSMLGLGHLARIHGQLDRERAFATLRNGLTDPDEYVRGHAEDALDDLEQYLPLD